MQFLRSFLIFIQAIFYYFAFTIKLCSLGLTYDLSNYVIENSYKHFIFKWVYPRYEILILSDLSWTRPHVIHGLAYCMCINIMYSTSFYLNLFCDPLCAIDLHVILQYKYSTFPNIIFHINYVCIAQHVIYTLARLCYILFKKTEILTKSLVGTTVSGPLLRLLLGVFGGVPGLGGRPVPHVQDGQGGTGSDRVRGAVRGQDSGLQETRRRRIQVRGSRALKS